MKRILVVTFIISLYIRGQKTLPFRARMKNGRSVFRSKRPRALARGASFFSVLGSIMAFLITYEEYTHHYADKRRPFRHAMQTAIFTFIHSRPENLALEGKDEKWPLSISLQEATGFSPWSFIFLLVLTILAVSFLMRIF